MDLQTMLSQCDPFLSWARQYPLMWQRVETAIGRIELLTGVPGLQVCQELRNSFYCLSVCADEGGFEQIASSFYDRYVQYCRLLLTYPVY